MLKFNLTLSKTGGSIASPIFLLFLLLITPTVEASSIDKAIQIAESKQLWKTKKWHRLLHYKDKLFSTFQSEAKGNDFFVHPVGKYDPKLELIATLKVLAKQKISNKHPICKFPARYKWLQRVTGFSEDLLNFERCEFYQNYLKTHNAEKIHLVFSSYYLESPASTFGHTLFRLSKSERLGSSKYTELLDTAISYGANMTTDNPILYTLLGTMGGFQGSLVSLPYYHKIREYNDHESRDLWSYELNLSQQERESVIDHIWELAHTHFDYYYFDENCSYVLLTILETARDDLDLISQLPSYTTIPVDTIKVVHAVPGLVSKVDYRPSIRRTANEQVSLLNDEEKTVFNKVIQNRDHKIINKINNPKSQAYITDALMSFIDLKHSSQILNESGENYEWKKKVLEFRSKINHPGIIKKVELPKSEMPHIAHPSARFISKVNHHTLLGESLQLEYRFAIHDILDPFPGQPKTSTIEFLNSKFRYYTELEEFKLHQLTLVKVKNLPPWSEYQMLPALSVNFGLKTMGNELCSLCLAPNFNIGVGSTHQFGSQFGLNFLMNTELSYSSKFRLKKYSIGLSPEFNLYFWWGEKATSRVSGRYINYFTQETYATQLEHETRFHISRKYDLIIKNQFRESMGEHSVGISFFH